MTEEQIRHRKESKKRWAHERWINLTPEEKQIERNKRREQYHKDVERNRELARVNREKNPLHKDKKKQWNESNREKTRQYDANRKDERREYYRKRRAEDIQYVLSRRLRERIRSALKYLLNGGGKKSRTGDLIGCSVIEFKTYLESKFTPGMSWTNLKNIHIDHIIPVSSFDLTDPEQQQKCFHYTNLQPLWADENRKKSDKLNY